MYYFRNTNVYFTNMDTHKYTCKYCHEQFIPKRRYSQKYCSNSCRSRAYHRRQVEKNALSDSPKPKTEGFGSKLPAFKPKETLQPQTMSNDKMSLAGVGNAAAGTLVADLIKYAFQGKGNQPATKNDIGTLINKLQRYHLITNLPPRPFGKKPYFDLHTNQVVYI